MSIQQPEHVVVPGGVYIDVFAEPLFVQNDGYLAEFRGATVLVGIGNGRDVPWAGGGPGAQSA